MKSLIVPTSVRLNVLLLIEYNKSLIFIIHIEKIDKGFTHNSYVFNL